MSILPRPSMATRGPYTVHCDADGCAASFFAVGRDAMYPSFARRAAEANGWRVRPLTGPGARKGPDLCPAHRPPP